MIEKADNNINTILNTAQAVKNDNDYQNILAAKKQTKTEAPKNNVINTEDKYVPSAAPAKKEEPEQKATVKGEAPPKGSVEEQDEELNDNVKNGLVNLQSYIASQNPAPQAPAAPDIN